MLSHHDAAFLLQLYSTADCVSDTLQLGSDVFYILAPFQFATEHSKWRRGKMVGHRKRPKKRRPMGHSHDTQRDERRAMRTPSDNNMLLKNEKDLTPTFSESTRLRVHPNETTKQLKAKQQSILTRSNKLSNR
jgi:hypothetical protein